MTEIWEIKIQNGTNENYKKNSRRSQAVKSVSESFHLDGVDLLFDDCLFVPSLFFSRILVPLKHFNE